MKIIRNEIRPVGYVTIELQEHEVQAIISCLDEIYMYRGKPITDMAGSRRDIYDALIALLKVK
jgi:hypothetical protein